MGISNSDISWWALPDRAFLGSFMSAHPVAAIGIMPSSCPSHGWRLEELHGSQQSSLPSQILALCEYSGLDGFLATLVGLLNCHFMLSGCTVDRWPWPQEPWADPPRPLLSWGWDGSGGQENRHAVLLLNLSSFSMGLMTWDFFPAFMSLLSDVGGMNMAVWMWWLIGCGCQVHSWKHQKRNETVLCVAAVHFSWFN